MRSSLSHPAVRFRCFPAVMALVLFFKGTSAFRAFPHVLIPPCDSVCSNNCKVGPGGLFSGPLCIFRILIGLSNRFLVHYGLTKPFSGLLSFVHCPLLRRDSGIHASPGDVGPDKVIRIIRDVNHQILQESIYPDQVLASFSLD